MAILDQSDRPNFLRASVLLLGLAWTLPFLQPYHRYPLTTFHSEWLAFALGLAALVPLLLRREPWRDLTVPLVALAPLALVPLLLAQVALDRIAYPGQALTAGLYLLWTALMVLLGHLLRRGLALGEIARTLSWFLLAGGVLHALVGLFQHFAASLPFDFLVFRRQAPILAGNLGQSNHYATSLTFSLASVAYLYARRQLGAPLATGTAALFLCVLVLAASRSPWLYLVVFVVFARALHKLRPDDATRRLARFTLWLLPGFVATQWLMTLPWLTPEQQLPVWTTGSRLFQIAGGIEPRILLWTEAWRIFLDAPFLGAGFGQFAWQHFLLQAAGGANAASGLVNHCHNLVLQLMAEMGMAGALVVVGVVIVWVADLRRVVAELDCEWWWLLSLLAPLGIHSLLEFPLWYSYFLVVAAVLLGMGAVRSFAVRLAGLAHAVVALAAIAGYFNLFAIVAPYRDFEGLVFRSEARSPVPENDVFTAAMMRIHDEPLLTPYVELAFAYSVAVEPERLQDKLELVARVARFAPAPDIVRRHAYLLAAAGDGPTALRQLERALSAYPEGAGEAVAELRELARSRPAEFTPLLKLAASQFGAPSAPPTGR